MILLLTGRAEVVTEYSDKIINSVTQSFFLPKILRLNNRHKSSHQVIFSRLNVYHRDDFTCQYCKIKYPVNNLTFDHVIPQSKGGTTSWDNIVTCCKICNCKKGDKSVYEFGKELHKIPKTPKWSPELCLRLKEDDPVEWWHWMPNFQKESA